MACNTKKGGPGCGSCSQNRLSPWTGTQNNEGCALTYNGQGAINLLKQPGKAISTTGNGESCCAAFAKGAMVSKNGGQMNNQYPSGWNGCGGSTWMRYWGFKPLVDKVFDVKPVPEELKSMLQVGDILIAMGTTGKHTQGHIQIWDGTGFQTDGWFKNAGVYEEGKNYWQIFRA